MMSQVWEKTRLNHTVGYKYFARDNSKKTPGILTSRNQGLLHLFSKYFFELALFQMLGYDQ